MIIVTDNALRAGFDFPEDEICSTVCQVLAIPDGSEVAVISYRSGAALDDCITAVNTLIDRGSLIELNPEKPLR